MSKRRKYGARRTGKARPIRDYKTGRGGTRL